MQEWEHLVLELDSAYGGSILAGTEVTVRFKVHKINGQIDPEWQGAGPYELYEILNAWGAKGWELAVFHARFLVLKRPAPAGSDTQTTRLPNYPPR
jgi:hypothetical protein